MRQKIQLCSTLSIWLFQSRSRNTDLWIWNEMTKVITKVEVAPFIFRLKEATSGLGMNVGPVLHQQLHILFTASLYGNVERCLSWQHNKTTQTLAQALFAQFICEVITQLKCVEFNTVDRQIGKLHKTKSVETFFLPEESFLLWIRCTIMNLRVKVIQKAVRGSNLCAGYFFGINTNRIWALKYLYGVT